MSDLQFPADMTPEQTRDHVMANCQAYLEPLRRHMGETMAAIHEMRARGAEAPTPEQIASLNSDQAMIDAMSRPFIDMLAMLPPAPIFVRADEVSKL